jgi:hypothetical protein
MTDEALEKSDGALEKTTPTTGQYMAAIQNRVENLFTDGERLIVFCPQLKFSAYCKLNRRVVICATSNRLIVVSRGRFGGFKMQDLQWQDLRDAQVSENIFPFLFGANFEVALGDDKDRPKIPFFSSGKLAVVGLESAPALTLYRFCQTQEQAWREKNRFRDLEDKRAAAGGIQLGAGFGGGQSSPQPSPQSAPAEDAMTRLSKAKGLLDAGVLTETEFEGLKAKIMAEL